MAIRWYQRLQKFIFIITSKFRVIKRNSTISSFWHVIKTLTLTLKYSMIHSSTVYLFYETKIYQVLWKQKSIRFYGKKISIHVHFIIQQHTAIVPWKWITRPPAADCSLTFERGKDIIDNNTPLTHLENHSNKEL